MTPQTHSREGEGDASCDWDAPSPTRCPSEWSDDGSLDGVVTLGYRDDSRTWKGLPDEVDVILLNTASASEMAELVTEGEDAGIPTLTKWSTGSLAFCEPIVGAEVGPDVSLEVVDSTLILHLGHVHKVIRATSDLLVFDWYSVRKIDWPGHINSARRVIRDFLSLVKEERVVVAASGDACTVLHDCDLPYYGGESEEGSPFGRVGRFKSEMYWRWMSRKHVGQYGPVTLVQRAILLLSERQAPVQLDSCHPCSYDLPILLASDAQREAEWGVCRIDVPGLGVPLMTYEADLGYENNPCLYVWRDDVPRDEVPPPYMLVGTDYGVGMVNSRIGVTDYKGKWKLHRCKVTVTEVVVPGYHAVEAASRVISQAEGTDWLLCIAKLANLTPAVCLMALSDRWHYPPIGTESSCVVDLYRQRAGLHESECPPIEAAHTLGTLLKVSDDGTIRDRLLSRLVCTRNRHLKWATGQSEVCCRSDVTGLLGDACRNVAVPTELHVMRGLLLPAGKVLVQEEWM